MALCPHFNTQNKHKKNAKVHPQQSRRISAHTKKIDLYSEKNHTLKKNHSVCKKKVAPGCPFACQIATAFSAPVSTLCRPHIYKRDISLLATADFHASSRFCCRDFLGFLFVLPILEPFFFCCRRSRHRKPAVTSTFLSFVRNRQPVTESVRYFRH